MPRLGGDALKHLVGHGEPFHLGVEHQFLNVGLLAGAEGQVGVQCAVLKHAHAIVGGNGGVRAAPFRDVVVGVPVFGQKHGADHIVQSALGPTIEADGQFLFHKLVRTCSPEDRRRR